MANTSARSDVYVGAASSNSGARGGIFRRTVGNGGWSALTEGLPEASHVQAITVHPTNPDIVYLGTRSGPYRSTNRGERWARLPFPDGTEVWSIMVHPKNPRILYAGTSPVGVYRSDDGGDSWRKLPKATQPERVKMKSFVCRVMRLAADPTRPDEVYAALEVGGVMRSLDAGESWEDCTSDLLKLAERPELKSKIDSDTEIEGMLDGHALCVSAARPGTVTLAVRMGLFQSADRGSSWKSMEIGRFSPLTYGRDVVVSPHDPRELFACLSPAGANLAVAEDCQNDRRQEGACAADAGEPVGEIGSGADHRRACRMAIQCRPGVGRLRTRARDVRVTTGLPVVCSGRV